MFPAAAIEVCRLQTIAYVWRMVGGRNSHFIAPSEWSGWHIEQTPEDDRLRYAKRAADGVCTRCGKVAPRPNRKLCRACADDQAARAKAHRDRRRASR